MSEQSDLVYGFVAVEYRDATGNHIVGERVGFDQQAYDRLVEAGILSATNPREVEVPEEVFAEEAAKEEPAPEALPEPTPEPTEGVKTKTTSRRRRPAQQKES